MMPSPPLPETDEYPSICTSLLRLTGRLVLFVLALLLVFWTLFHFLISWVQLPANDFGRMYASAAAFAEGQDMYAWTKATPAWLHSLYGVDLYNMNPPHFHLLLLPLTLLPSIDHAFVVWWVLSGLCLFLVLRWTLKEIDFTPTPQQRQLAWLAGLCFCGTTAMIFTGQLSFFLLVPLTLMWIAARRGLWGWSGALLGIALSVKPFLGIVLAYFIWRRHWRAAFTCLGSLVLCFAVGLLVFGWDNHLSWRDKISVADGWAWLPMNAGLMGFLSRVFTESVWYVPLVALPSVAVWGLWLGIGCLLGLLTLGATTRGETRADVDHDLALVLLASVLLCPLGWIYYLWLALPPMLALVVRGWPKLENQTPLAGEPAALAAGFRHPAANAAGSPGQRLRLRWTGVLLVVAGIAAAWPLTATRLGQPEFIWFWKDASPALALAADEDGRIPGPMLVRSDIPRWDEPWFFAPQSLASLTVGSIYFWGLLCLWGSLVWSGLVLRKRLLAPALPELAPLAPGDYRVSVVMPVFSETETVRQIADWLTTELGPQLEEIVIVQSPRSSSESQAVCRQLAEEQPHIRVQMQQQNPGLGRAVREGFANVRGNLVLSIDADGEMEIDTVPRMLHEMSRSGCAMVTASRWLPGGGFSGYSRMKYHLNWCFQQLFRWLFWTRLTDLTYGFKLTRAELVRGIDWQGTLHEIACETTLKPVRLGLPVSEVPSKWTARTQGVSKNTFWRNFRYVRLAWSILWNGVPFREVPAPEKLPSRTESGVADRQPDSCACVV